MDVYVAQSNLNQAIEAPQFNGNFEARLFFVIRSDEVRQREIRSINQHYPVQERRTCSIPVTTSRGITYKRNQSCSDIEGTAQGKIDRLKYIGMHVLYFKKGQGGLFGTKNGFIPGPIIRIESSEYLAPLECVRIRPGGFYADLPSSQFETVVSGDTGRQSMPVTPVEIGVGVWAFENGSNAPRWNIILGDLEPLKTEVGYDPVRLTEQTPLMNVVLKNIEELIQQRRLSR